MAPARSATWLLILAGFGLSPQGRLPPPQTLSIGEYELVSDRIVGRRIHELTYRARLTNVGSSVKGVVAVAKSLRPTTVIVDGTLSFGPTPMGGSSLSSDTFSLRRDPRVRFRWSDIRWTITPVANQRPVADAGPDQTAGVGNLVTLNGSGSTDADGDRLNYTWTFSSRPPGSAASLSDAFTVGPSFEVDVPGQYVVQLIVDDGIAQSEADRVVVSTRNSTPVARAGPGQTASLGQVVTLDGSQSFDVDGDALTFLWRMTSRPGSSTAVLTGRETVRPTFVVDVPGRYVIQLVVNDGREDSLPDSVVVSTGNTPPVAHAGPDRTARVGDTVTLDGSGSTDVDGDPLTYAWSLVSAPAGSAAHVSESQAVASTIVIDWAGTYVVQLMVSDGLASSAPDTVTINTENSPPTAVAGADRTVLVGQMVLLDGTQSFDADGDPLTFQWALVAVPAESGATLVNPTRPGPSFIADRAGTYVVQLIVHDGMLSSAPASVTVTTANARPAASAGPDRVDVPVGQPVTLDGSQSSDADGDPLTYSWSLIASPPGSSAALDEAVSAAPTFTPDVAGDYVAQLIVHDGIVASEPDTVLIRAVGATPGNRPPVAHAGIDRSATAGEHVTLDGSASFDPDGDPIGYEWTFVSTPAGSVAVISGANTVAPSFTADRRGVYDVSLTVSDGRGGTATDQVVVTALNRAPIAVSDTATTIADAAVLIDVLANDSDPDADPLVIASVTQPASGSVEIEGALLRFTPAPGATGTATFAYTAGDGNGGTASALVTVTVSPSGALPSLSIDDLSAMEGDAGSTALVFTVTQSAPSSSATTVSYATADGTATAPADYVAAAGIATIPAGSTSVEITITINGDASGEDDKTLLVRLSNPVNATLARAQGTATIIDDDPGPPTTFDLIDAALAQGVIDEETSLVYRVFAEFRDPRLPAEYRGREQLVFEGKAIREAALRFGSLSPATQAIIAPFLEFPDLFAAPDASDRTAIRSLRATTAGASLLTAIATDSAETFRYVAIDLLPGSIRLGWNDDSPLASSLADAASRLKLEFDTRIWPKLRTFAGPPSGRVLILLDDIPGTSFERVSEDCTTAYIRLHDFAPVVLTHELTHALVDLNFAIAACNDREKLWMQEATATWAQHYVYPPANEGREQNTAPWFLRAPDRPLSDYDRSPRGHEYGAYLWFFRLAGQGNNPGIVRAMWEAGAGVTSLEAIESTLQASGLGGFEAQWPRFALDNWNRHAPYRKYYEWDRLDHQAAQAEYTVRGNGGGWQQVSIGYDLPILTASYQRWDFSQDTGVRTIHFMNSNAGGRPNARIHALVKIKDQPWKEAEDWTNASEKVFCRDKAAEDVEEIVLVFTNVGYRQSDARIEDRGALTFLYSGLPCSDWTGTTDYRQESRSGEAVEVTRATGTGLRFRQDSENRGVWRAIAGTVNVSYEATSPFEDGTCTGRAATQFQARDRAQFWLLPLEDGIGFLGTDLAFLPNPPTLPVAFTCSSSSGTFTYVLDVPWFGVAWFHTGPVPRPFDPTATMLQGSYSFDDEEWTWNLAKDE